MWNFQIFSENLIFRFFLKIWNFRIFYFFQIFSENLKFSENFLNFSHFSENLKFSEFFGIFHFFSENLKFSDFFWFFQIFSKNIIFNINLNLNKTWNFQNFSDLHNSWSVDVHGKSPRALVKNVWQQRRKKWARENMLFETFFWYFWRMGKRLQHL